MMCFCKKNFLKTSFAKTKKNSFIGSFFSFYKMLISTQRIVMNKYPYIPPPFPKKTQMKRLWKIIILTESPSFSGMYYMNLNTEWTQPWEEKRARISLVCACVCWSQLTERQYANKRESVKFKSQLGLGHPLPGDLCSGFSPASWGAWWALTYRNSKHPQKHNPLQRQRLGCGAGEPEGSCGFLQQRYPPEMLNTGFLNPFCFQMAKRPWRLDWPQSWEVEGTRGRRPHWGRCRTWSRMGTRLPRNRHHCKIVMLSLKLVLEQTWREIQECSL